MGEASNLKNKFEHDNLPKEVVFWQIKAIFP